MMETGLKITIKVDGFYDAKDWMYRLLKAGVATCACCDKPAVQIWWNDAAEWYFHCAEHYETAPMWGGSTRWNPSSFSKNVIPGKVQEWVATLSPDEQGKITLRTFDATDYYALIPDEQLGIGVSQFVLSGTAQNGYAVTVYALTDGRYAYMLAFNSPNFGYYYGLQAPFPSADYALYHARASLNW